MKLDAIKYGYALAIKDFIDLVDRRKDSRMNCNDITRAKDKELLYMIDLFTQKEQQRFQEFQELEALTDEDN